MATYCNAKEHRNGEEGVLVIRTTHLANKMRLVGRGSSLMFIMNMRIIMIRAKMYTMVEVSPTTMSTPMMSVVTLLVSLAMPGSCSEETEERLRRGHANVHHHLGGRRLVSCEFACSK